MHSSLSEGMKQRDSHQRFGVLSLLEHRGALGLKELADEFGLSSSSLCIMMNRLEEAHLIRREAHPSDRRRILYALTDVGLDHLIEERKVRMRAMEETLNNWTDEEREEILSLSRRLGSLLERGGEHNPSGG